MTFSSTPPFAANEVCTNCGEFVEQLVEETGWCKDCSPKARNVEHIEHYKKEGLSLRKAIKRAATDVKPTCAVCGKPMNRAKRNAVICRRTVKCRQTARRYAYLYSEKGYTKAEALAEVLRLEEAES